MPAAARADRTDALEKPVHVELRQRPDRRTADPCAPFSQSVSATWSDRSASSEVALRADYALVLAFLADYLGNLTYVLTARNYNPVVAMAGDTVIATAEHIVPVASSRQTTSLYRRLSSTTWSATSELRHEAADHHRATDSPGAEGGHARQPWYRYPDPSGQLRATVQSPLCRAQAPSTARCRSD